MNPHDQMMEALGILQEECAETVVVISKIRRFGIDTEYQRGAGTKRDNLTQECGDILAMIGILVKQGVLEQDSLQAAAIAKIEKLKKYSTLQNLDDVIV
jgi:NTP pyrophosphatase (non-canonical NTP hydrolase)